MHAIILAGGKGARLLPYTKNRPKPLMRLGRYSILEVMIRRLRACNFDRVTLCIAHRGDMIREEFGGGGHLGLTIDYCTDQPPSGTAAPLLLVPEWDSPAVVMNADILTAIDFAHLHRVHEHSGSALTVAFQRRQVPVDLGVLQVIDGQVHAMWEKPSLAIDVSSGMYVIDPSVKDCVPDGETVDMPDVIEALLRKGERVNAYGFREEWFDIGTPTTYKNAEREFMAKQGHYLSPSTSARSTTLDGASAEVMLLPTWATGRPQLGILPVHGGARRRSGAQSPINEVNMNGLVAIIGRSMGHVLACPPLAATDDFFGLGGDSHRAMQVVAELVTTYGPDDSALAEKLHEELVLTMFDDSTPQALATVFGKY
ncbi:sugar phosphate nucleotidyltransferase [Nocardia sp. CA-128927]|uniref:sugar phosphate nucleotidyltransferase n=1 Tax=Nocardia sp. CA-128927 TaxID=3239975 RepID=UPI003D95F005